MRTNIVFLFALLTTFAFGLRDGLSQPGKSFEPDRIIITLRESSYRQLSLSSAADGTPLTGLATLDSLNKAKRVKKIEQFFNQAYTLIFADTVDVESLIRVYSMNEHVALAELYPIIHVDGDDAVQAQAMTFGMIKKQFRLQLKKLFTLQLWRGL